MGLFKRGKATTEEPSLIEEEYVYISEKLQDESVQLQLMAMMTFIAALFALRVVSKNLVKGLGGEHILSIHGEFKSGRPMPVPSFCLSYLAPP